ncbi:MAG: DUF883 family protein [Azonexus sp.]
MSNVTDLSNNQKIVADMKAVVSDAEDIFRETASVAGDKMLDVRQRISERLGAAKVRVANAEAAVLEKSKLAAAATDACVRKNPWQSVGIAASVGLVLGMLIGRR